MALTKVTYKDKQVVIPAKNLNDIQDAIIELESMVECAVVVNDASGEKVSVTGSANAPLVNLRLLGKTKQVTTTGANLATLLSSYGDSRTINGITFARNSDGSIAVSGTAAASTYAWFEPITINPTDVYTVSGCPANSSEEYALGYQVRNGETALLGEQEYGSGVTYNGDKSTADNLRLYIYVMAGATVSATFYPMLNAGNTALPYEPYTGGKASPHYEYPQELAIPGTDGDIAVTVGDQSLVLSTPNGLPGIPVKSGGNYTDADGQQWICDEKNFQQRKYIQRIGVATIDSFNSATTLSNGLNVGVFIPPNKMYVAAGSLCSHAILFGGLTSQAADGLYYENPANFIFVGTAEDTIDTLNAKYSGAKLLYVLAKPVETDLTDEEVAAFNELRSSYPSTAVTNDSGAWMETRYVADKRMYIDQKFEELKEQLSQ